jgi:serine/threonine-protein kinase
MPDNLFVTSDARIKILDFGIAKLTRPGENTSGRTGLATETGAGTVIGTARYMSPEQVRGEEVDGRSDIFSVGAVLYEMLTGRPSFARDTTAETMVAILKEEPPGSMPPAVSPALERIVLRCLEKTREARFQSARDLAFSLECLAGGTAPALPSAPVTVHGLGRRAASWVVAGVLALALGAVLVRGLPSRSAVVPASMRVSVELGADAPLAPLNTQFGGAATLSPDGTLVAFVAQGGEEAPALLHVRHLDQLRAVALRGTDGAVAPFFSPDGRWIGFFAGQKLHKIAVTGGAPADAPSPRGGAWGDDDTIVFAPRQVAGTRLLRIPAAGGRAEPLTSLADGEVIQLTRR